MRSIVAAAVLGPKTAGRTQCRDTTWLSCNESSNLKTRDWDRDAKQRDRLRFCCIFRNYQIRLIVIFTSVKGSPGLDRTLRRRKTEPLNSSPKQQQCQTRPMSLGTRSNIMKKCLETFAQHKPRQAAACHQQTFRISSRPLHSRHWSHPSTPPSVPAAKSLV